ncbi:MAG: GHMP kinase, partial [Candidatus Bipolaricaulis sp.]|nr:GHMP kinase [Candidatus Bipolaricaulis sp.]
MIISRTPLRISFVGGGTDIPAFYRDHEGAVVSTAIDKSIYLFVNPKFDRRIRVSYSITEVVDSVDELRHELVRESLKAVGIRAGIEIASISDVPAHGTGLGSSSAYTVGLLNALWAYQGKTVPAERLAREACEIEIERCGKPIGKQDQYIAAFGGMQFIRFQSNGQVAVDPVRVAPETKERLERSLLLLYTGIARESDAVLKEQGANTRRGNANSKALVQMARMAHDLRAALEAGRPEEMGELLHAGWQLKRQLANGITNPQIDAWYETARDRGAFGGKILGAGGGGFLLLYAPPERHERILQALP